MMNDVREAENKPAWTAVSQHYGHGVPFRAKEREKTHEYKDTVHIILQGLYPGLVVALGFLFVERPQSVGTVVKVPNHPPCA